MPVLPQSTRNLSTQIVGDRQYYYCESCNAPTQLSEQVYKPLEPDTAIPVIEPMVPAATNIQMKSHKPVIKRRIRSTSKYKHGKGKLSSMKVSKLKAVKKTGSSKTCIKWSE